MPRTKHIKYPTVTEYDTKAGDKVICVSTMPQIGGDAGKAFQAGLKEGAIYTVTEISSPTIYDQYSRVTVKEAKPSFNSATGESVPLKLRTEHFRQPVSIGEKVSALLGRDLKHY